jgi:hypothetical protein
LTLRKEITINSINKEASKASSASLLQRYVGRALQSEKGKRHLPLRTDSGDD